MLWLFLCKIKNTSTIVIGLWGPICPHLALLEVVVEFVWRNLTNNLVFSAMRLWSKTDSESRLNCIIIYAIFLFIFSASSFIMIPFFLGCRSFLNFFVLIFFSAGTDSRPLNASKRTAKRAVWITVRFLLGQFLRISQDKHRIWGISRFCEPLPYHSFSSRGRRYLLIPSSLVNSAARLWPNGIKNRGWRVVVVVRWWGPFPPNLHSVPPPSLSASKRTVNWVVWSRRALCTSLRSRHLSSPRVLKKPPESPSPQSKSS